MGAEYVGHQELVCDRCGHTEDLIATSKEVCTWQFVKLQHVAAAHAKPKGLLCPECLEAFTVWYGEEK